MYSFEDKNGEHVCLRPEGTAGILRSMLQHNIILIEVSRNKNFDIMALCLDMKNHNVEGLDNLLNLVLNTSDMVDTIN